MSDIRNETREWYNVCGPMWVRVGFKNLADAEYSFRQAASATHIEHIKSEVRTTTTILTPSFLEQA